MDFDFLLPEWRTRIGAVVIALGAPRIVTAVLGLALATTVWSDGYDLYHLNHRGRAVVMNDILGGDKRHIPGDRRAFIADIVNAHLFGATAPAAGAPDGPVTEVDDSLVLTGTIALSDPLRGFALLGARKEDAHLYAVGATVAGRGTLRRVFPGYVVVERDGQQRIVWLPRQAGVGLLQARNDEPPGEEVPDPGRIRDAIAAKLSSQNSRMAAVLTLAPYSPEGEFRGIRIGAGPNPGLLAQMGLKPGDVVHHVDGTMIVDGDRLDMLANRLASGKPVVVSVTRPGEGAVDVTVNSALLAGLIQ